MDAKRGERSIVELLAEIRAMLSDGGVPDPDADAELLVAHALTESRGRVQALTVLGATLSVDQVQYALELAAERARRIPLQHLTGVAPFRRIELSVGPGVFVPRPETESVTQHAIDALRYTAAENPIAVDLCTGSGAIALALADEVPEARIWAMERSIEAHAWAKRNIEALGHGRVSLHLADAADAAEILAELRGRVDVLISNPPYVPDGMVPRDPEVRDHDPALALYSGADGLDLVRTISRVAHQLVAPGGLLVLEHAEMQGAAIRGILTSDGWAAAETHLDLTGRDRATTARQPHE